MMRNNFLKTFFLLTLFLCGVKLSAQPPLKARPLNVFTLPEQAVTINVLDKSELGACGVAATGVIRLGAAEAPGTLQHGTATVDINNNIVYTPSSATFSGQDSLKYVLTCGAKRDTALVLINMDDKPEVVKDACAIDPVPGEWGIREVTLNTSVRIDNYLPLVAGDIDGDGETEIIAGGTRVGIDFGDYNTNQLLLFRWNSTTERIELKRTITLNVPVSGNGTIGIVRHNNQGYIVVGGYNRYLYAYGPDGTLLWQSDTPMTAYQYRVGFADFNRDGVPEVFAGNRIYSLIDGKLLCDGGTGNNGSTYAGNQTVAADMDGDGLLEIVAGTQIYKVTITNPDGTAGNSVTVIPDMQLSASQLPPQALQDGTTQVADVDNDGRMEVVVISCSGGRIVSYVWKPLPGNASYLMGSFACPVAGNGPASIPLIGNIDDDPALEYLFITNKVPLEIYCLKFDFTLPAGSQVIEKWRLPHTDSSSGDTGMTLFDFDQDGRNEIVYRDQDKLRIFDGSGSSAVTYATFNNVTSGTLRELPIIVDIDNDGEAEILIQGDLVTQGEYGYLRVFKSDGFPWAPTRKVWNQYAYNPVYVNDDLTIPAYPLNPATKFVKKDGTFHQPFNNFLQQATLLNEDGEMLRYGPRLTFDNLSSDPVTFTYPGALGSNSVDASFSVSNIGDNDFPGPLDISAYLLQGGNFIYLGTHTEPTAIAVGASVSIGYTIDFGAAGITGDPRDFIQLRLNDRGDGIGRDADSYLPQECNYSGHFSRDLFGAPDYPLCGGEEATIYFYPQNNPSYSYFWYDTDPGVGTPAAVHEGESYTFIKSPTEASEVFYVDVWEAETGLKVGDTYTVKTFLVPDTLVWTAGGKNNDWNDPDNWFYPGGPDYGALGTDVKYKVPGSCTNVEIPSPALLSDPHYPDLKEGETAYPGPYTGARCNRIWYRSGGETARTDSLHYNLAYVDLTLDTHRWYMISAPLKSMYTGDYYIREQNPYRDERMYEPMFFNVTNPQTMETPVVAWTGRFHNADLLLAAGQGMAIWYDKTDEGYTYHDPVTSSFPKPDIYYGYYAPDGHAEYYTGLLNRDGCNRFIYEPLSSDGTVPLSLGGQPGTKDVPLLIGNPFMAHLDMEKFLSDNDTQLYGGYKLASGVASVDGKMNNFISYQRSGESWFSTDPDVQDLDAARYVAPMQSFIVVPKADAPDIRAHVESMTTLPSGALRSGEPAPDGIKMLGILAVRGEERSRALVLYPDDASDAFDPGEDSYRLFPDNNEIPLLVYTRSTDGYALDINSMKTFETRVPLGIRSSLPGTVTLIFSETAALEESADVYLYDTKEDKYLNLSEQNEYTFTKQPEDPLYLEDRFRLYLEPKAMGLSDVYSSLSVSSSGGSIEIVSEDGGALRNIRITDVQGRILSEESNFPQSRYRFRTPGAGLYIVRVANEHSAVTKKIMVR